MRRLLAWLTGNTYPTTAPRAVSPSNLRVLPNRLSCAGWECDSALEDSDGIYCVDCARGVR